MRTFESVADLARPRPNHRSKPLGDHHQEACRPLRRRDRDHQWIHVDPERAAKGPLGETIAHGFMTLALLPLPA